MTYAGLLEKCTAVSFTEMAGIRVQRREQQYLFDADCYREWRSSGSVWLYDRPS